MNAVRWLSFSTLGFLALACGNGSTETPSIASGGSTSSAPNGGTTARGGSSTGNSNSSIVGGNNAQGGNAQGGNAQGGNAQGGNAQGGNAQGGSSQTSPQQGGNGQGGSANRGGASPAGGTSTVGASSNAGGTSPKGGTSNSGIGGVGATTNKGGATAAGGNANGGSSNGGANAGGTNAVGGSAVQGGNASGGTTSSAVGNGYIPVPNAQNATNFDVSAWYTKWKGKYYKDCGSGNPGRIVNGESSDTAVSEGIGYGMLLAVGNDDRPVFDKLWAFYKAHLDPNGLMNWTINGCGASSGNQYAATDGDEDVAMALVQADAKWGGYSADAKALIGKIKQFEVSLTTTPTYLRPGDADNNGGKGEGVVNPSYFSPGYWHVWATYTNDDSWNKLATDAYAMLAKFQKLTISNYTNLVPDWGKSDGTNPNGGGYYYDACRTPWRVAIDYVWFGTPDAKTFLTNISTFVDGRGGIASTPFDKNSAFLGAFALSGMAVSQEKADTYLNAWLSTSMDDNPYFQGSLRGIYLLLANNKFPKGI